MFNDPQGTTTPAHRAPVSHPTVRPVLSQVQQTASFGVLCLHVSLVGKLAPALIGINKLAKILSFQPRYPLIVPVVCISETKNVGFVRVNGSG